MAHCVLAGCTPDAPAQACSVLVCSVFAQVTTQFVQSGHQCAGIAVTCALAAEVVVCAQASCAQPSGEGRFLGCDADTFCLAGAQELPCPDHLELP